MNGPDDAGELLTPERWGIELGEGGPLLGRVTLAGIGAAIVHEWTREAGEAFTVSSADAARTCIAEFFTLEQHAEGLQPVNLARRRPTPAE